MSITHQMKSTYTYGSTSLAAVTREVTGGAENNFDWSIASGAVNSKYTLGSSITVANLLHLYWSADQPITLKAGGANEVQQLAITGSPTGGTVAWTFGAQTATVPYNATAASFKSLAEALSSVGSGNLSVSGGPLPGTPIVYEFVNSLALANQAQATTVDSLTGGSTPASSVSTTTNGAAATVTLSVAASLPMDWDSAGVFTNPFAGISSLATLWASNSSGSAANLKARNVLSS